MLYNEASLVAQLLKKVNWRGDETNERPDLGDFRDTLCKLIDCLTSYCQQWIYFEQISLSGPDTSVAPLESKSNGSGTVMSSQRSNLFI